MRTLHRTLDRRGYQPNTLVTVDPGDINPDDLAVLDPRQYGNIARHINDSSKPNCDLITSTFGRKSVVMVRAITAIRVHDEATSRYGFTTAATNHPIRCKCKATDCGEFI